MPESPELAGVVSFLAKRIVGNLIASIQIGAISAIKTADPPVSALAGARISAVDVIGKFLILRTAPASSAAHSGAAAEDTGATIAIHLSRAGWLRWTDEPPKSAVRMGRGPLAARVTFVTPDGEIVGALDLTEAGTQKRLAIYTAHSSHGESQVPGIARLGPDVTSPDFTGPEFERILAKAGGKQLKTLLRDQTHLAGIGNAYSDEILFEARLSPTTPASSLSTEQTQALFTAIQECLESATQISIDADDLRKLKDAKRSHLKVHGRAGKPCPRCGAAILEVSSADSSYQYCADCQTGGKPLANRRMSRLLK